VNERITATPFPPAHGASCATAARSIWCDWWPWLYAIEPSTWANLTPLPPVSVSTDTT
jgi:hypothetical protein